MGTDMDKDLIQTEVLAIGALDDHADDCSRKSKRSIAHIVMLKSVNAMFMNDDVLQKPLAPRVDCIRDKTHTDDSVSRAQRHV